MDTIAINGMGCAACVPETYNVKAAYIATSKFKTAGSGKSEGTTTSILRKE